MRTITSVNKESPRWSIPSSMLLVLTINRMPTHHALGLLVSRKSKCIICVSYCCTFFLYLYLCSSFWGTFLMDIFLEHEVSVLSCFFLLFQFCSVYVKGNGIYFFSMY